MKVSQNPNKEVIVMKLMSAVLLLVLATGAIAAERVVLFGEFTSIT